MSGRGGYTGALAVRRSGFRQHCRRMAEPEQARAAESAGRSGTRPRRRRAHTTSRDLERYAGLFAKRTQVMRSSAMRDLMAITARPEVISLAGGLPDTSTFPPESFAAQMTRIAHESSAEALQYGPTEGFEETKACIVEVMEAEGMSPDPDDMIVTTGGQQAIDLIAKTLIDPGDPVICEAPTYPGAVPTFCSYEADVIQVTTDDDGMRIDELEEVLDRLAEEGRRPKFIYSVPSFQNPAGVTLSAERRRAPGRAGARARGAGRRGQPLRAAPLRGRAAAAALRARRRRLRPLPRHLLEDPLARDPGRLGRRAAAGAGEDRARQAGRRPLHLDPDPVLRPRVLRRGPLARVHRRPDRDLPRPPRRDARGARAPLPRAGRVDPPRGRACSSGRRCPTTSTPPTCWRRRCARTSPSSPAAPPTSTAAAAHSMRLNFSGSTEDEIREGIRRIGARGLRAGRRSTRRSPASTDGPRRSPSPTTRAATSSRCRARKEES